MKAIIFIILVLLHTSDIFSNVTDSTDSNISPQESIKGLWLVELGVEKLFFHIDEDSEGNYYGHIITYINDQPVSCSKLENISYDGSVLRMLTNPQHYISFEGVLDESLQCINGILIFKDGSKRKFNLARYSGKENERVMNLMNKQKIRKYSTIEELEKINSISTIEVDPTKISTSKTSEIDLIKEDIIAVINRWYWTIYVDNGIRSSALLTAFLVDPVTNEITSNWKELIKDYNSTEKKISTINKWTTSNLAYTQGDKQFVNYPGKDPWGTFQDGVTPTFKKLIPSEMAAMKFYTNKISGKCFTLVNLVSSCFIQLGVHPDDIVIVINKTGEARHAMALIRYEDQILLSNLIYIDFLKNYVNKDFGTYKITGIYNHKFYHSVDINIRNTDLEKLILSDAPTLLESFIEQFNLGSEFKDDSYTNDFNYENRSQLYNKVFNKESKNYSNNLAKYAYQSLSVKHPEYYLEASMNSASVKDLSQYLNSPLEIINWINSHIRTGSIFSDSDERIMTADQVLVFQQGSFKDKGVLCYTLLKHKGYNPVIKVSKENAFIELGDKIYDFKNNQLINTITENILLTLE